MARIEIKIENKRYQDALTNLQSCITDTKKETVENINRLLPSFKAGWGGSHIWVSLPDNTRIAIIYFK